MNAANHGAISHPVRRRVSKDGFTLVELLVVVGIIALLIAFLLPALRKAREAAITTACLSNMKQIGTAIAMYANASGGWFPNAGNTGNGGFVLDLQANIPAGKSQTDLSWPERIVRQGVLDPPAGSPVVGTPSRWTYCGGGSQYWPVMGRGVFRCPGYGEGSYEYGKVEARSAGYGLNRFVTPEFSSSKTAGFAKLASYPQGIVILADGWFVMSATLPQAIQANVAFTNWNNTVLTTPTYSGLYLRHNNGANYLFTDLHAEWSSAYHKTGYLTPNNVWADGTRLDPSSTVGGTIFRKVRETISGD